MKTHTPDCTKTDTSPAPMLTCPICNSGGFTPGGLRAHRCTGINRQTGAGTPIPKRRLTQEELAYAMDATPTTTPSAP